MGLKPMKQLPVKKNEYYEVMIEDLTHEGMGVAKVDGYALFIPDVLKGEHVKIKVVKTKKGFGFGKLVEVMKESPERTEPICEVYGQCGGCMLQHMSYDEQLHFKENLVKNNLERIGHFSNLEVRPIIGMQDGFYYRNKAQVPVRMQNEKVTAGFFRPRSHDIIDMKKCYIQHETNNELIQIVRDVMEELHIDPYDEEKHRGVVRHIMTRIGVKTGEVMLVLVTKTQKFPMQEIFVQKMVERYKGITSIIQNVNSKRTNVILGEKNNLLYGEPTIKDYIGDIQFEISPHSFFQVNPEQTEKLYREALNAAQLTGKETVIDAYCGIGTISLFLAKQAKKVYGVEVVPEAIQDAKRNAKLNEIENIEFEVGKAEETMGKWKEVNIKADVIVVDPPRKGCDRALLDTMIEMKPTRVVYVSCNPATLARDLRVLADGGFNVEYVQPVDMFPQTNHVETVVLMSRKEK